MTCPVPAGWPCFHSQPSAQSSPISAKYSFHFCNKQKGHSHLLRLKMNSKLLSHFTNVTSESGVLLPKCDFILRFYYLCEFSKVKLAEFSNNCDAVQLISSLLCAFKF